MDWTTILAGAALAAALAALAYAWAGFRVLTDAAILNADRIAELQRAVLAKAEYVAKLREIDATLSDHVQWHVAQRMANSISLVRDIEQTTDMDKERC